SQQAQIADLQGTNRSLAEENRAFRRLILGIVHRLEVIAAWVRDGHQPPPPYTTEQLLEYIREQAPHLGKDEYPWTPIERPPHWRRTRGGAWSVPSSLRRSASCSRGWSAPSAST